MGGGDLNMKKSWHPVLLVNQERVWKAEKQQNEEKKKLAQLRKEQDEERQLAELQRLQEAATGRKRVEKLDWMYAAPGNEGGALGGAKLGEREMEDYLLGKKRVDEVLGQGDKNVGNSHKDFIAVQNANTARDTAAKIREDPLLAIKRQELAQYEALKSRPDVRRKLVELAKKKGESSEDRKARKKAEKEERRKARHERRERHRGYKDSRSPRSDYSDDYDRKRKRSSYDERDDRDRRYRDRSRSSSPRPYRDDDRDYRRRDPSPRRHRDEPRERRRSPDYSRGTYRGGPDDRYVERDIKPEIKPSHSRPSATDMADRPISSSAPSRPFHTNGNGNGTGNGNGNGPAASTLSLEEQRAARLAAMSTAAHDLNAERTKTLAQRAEEERKEAEQDERMRKKYSKDDVKSNFYGTKGDIGLSESIQRRAGQGLQRSI